MTPSALGLVTIVHGRHDHLRLQEQSLARGARPEVRVVVAMDDAQVAGLAPDAALVQVPRRRGRLPLAAARNAGARAALDRGAERLVFLDVDCLVDDETLLAYAAPEPAGLTTWCGPVTYLHRDDRPYDVETLRGLHDPHPGRPDPGPGRRVRDDRGELFWSLSFALDADTWDHVGGFDEAYEGYGAEDTDFGQRLARAGSHLVWCGDARAYHQWHPSPAPPVQHCEDIVRNANLFHDRWGWWPMVAWLEALQERGLTVRNGDGWAVAS